MTIYEDSRTISRADLAAWLRQIADQLDSGGRIFFGAGGTVAVADRVRCELEIERESHDEMSVEIEFSFAAPAPGGPTAAPAEGGAPGEDEECRQDRDSTGVAEETTAGPRPAD